jgi:hypothetical protein
MDLGLDLDRARNLPECAACRKKSDGAKQTGGLWLCGTHTDEWMVSPEWREPYQQGGPDLFDPKEYRRRLDLFVARLRRERYAACWDVSTDP